MSSISYQSWKRLKKMTDSSVLMEPCTVSSLPLKMMSLFPCPALKHFSIDAPKNLQNSQNIFTDRSLRCCLPFSQAHLWNQTKHFSPMELERFHLNWDFLKLMKLKDENSMSCSGRSGTSGKKVKPFLFSVQWSATQQLLFPESLNDSCTRVNLLK